MSSASSPAWTENSLSKTLHSRLARALVSAPVMGET